MAQMVLLVKRDMLTACSVVESESGNVTEYNGLVTVTIEEQIYLASFGVPMDPPHRRSTTATTQIMAQVNYDTGMVSQVILRNLLLTSQIV